MTKKLNQILAELYRQRTVANHLPDPGEDIDLDGAALKNGTMADLDDEQIEDVVSSLLAAGDKLSWTYDDANGTLTVDTTAFAPVAGEILVDGTDTYSDAQTAVDNATNAVEFGAGTFGSIDISTAGLVVKGTGRATTLEDTGDHAIEITAADVTVMDLEVNAPNDRGIFINGDIGNINLRHTHVADAGTDGIAFVNGGGSSFDANHRIENCDVFSPGGDGIYVGWHHEGAAIQRCFVKNPSGDAVACASDRAKVRDCSLTGAGTYGIYASGDDMVVSGNLVFGSSNDDITLTDSNILCASNRVGTTPTDSGTSNLITSNEVDSFS